MLSPWDLVLLATSCARFPNSLQLAHLPDGTRNLITEAVFSTSLQTIDCCVCNGLISTESRKLIGTKLSFQVNRMQECLYTGSPSRQTIDRSVCNGLISTESSKLIGTKLSFQVNHAAICGIMMAAFVLDTMSVNAAF